MKIEAKESRVLDFAKKELKSYLRKMGNPDLTITLEAYAEELDDAYEIDIDEKGGKIAGSNERSVLLGVYRYLTLIGCAFLRPGKENEVIPCITDPKGFAAKESHKASLRHRGVCLEGATSIKVLEDFLDYLPKAGYNSFFFQFKYPYTFMERWYAHRENELLKPQPFTMEDAERFFEVCNDWQLDRGLLQHRVGHGWTSLAIGCTATGWDTEEKVFTEKERMRIAELGGKRELFYGVPTNTNLCMSNPDAQEAYAQAVADYVKDNPDCDYLHLWLADGSNNSCECENCRQDRMGRKIRPSDNYINMLNLVDEKLTEMGSDVKLVMLLYVDLLWAPVVTKPKNPERFVLMFAPINRTFERSFDDVKELYDTPEFVLNQLKFPLDLEYNLRFLKDWQAMTEGSDCFDYDYYMGRAHYSDPTYINLSSIIARDLKKHKELGLNGINSCQELRASLPNGLANHIMGQFSLNTELDFEAETEKYYENCYGADGKKVLAVMKPLSDCFHLDFVLRRWPDEMPEWAEDLKKAPELLKQLAEIVKDHAPVNYYAQAHCWEELAYFVKYTEAFVKMVAERLAGHIEEGVKIYNEEYLPLVRQHEIVDEMSLDVYRIFEIVGRAMRAR